MARPGVLAELKYPKYPLVLPELPDIRGLRGIVSLLGKLLLQESFSLTLCFATPSKRVRRDPSWRE